jgi:hypothetical protein
VAGVLPRLEIVAVHPQEIIEALVALAEITAEFAQKLVIGIPLTSSMTK